MSKYKLAAFDMDGTLLNSKQEIPQTSFDSMRKAADAGKYLCLSTGRNLAELKRYRDQLPMVQYLMCISGSLIINNQTDEKVFEKVFDTETVLNLFEIAKESDVLVHMHGWDSHFQRDNLNKMADYGMGQYCDMFRNVCVLHDDLYEDFKKNPWPVYKFNFYCKNTDVRDEVEAKVKDYPITFCYAETKSFECSPKGISKASGLEYLCNHLGISIDEAIAVGDADNDIEILKAAGLGVAMGNANENVMAIADVKVKDCDSDGIKEVIESYLLG